MDDPTEMKKEYKKLMQKLRDSEKTIEDLSIENKEFAKENEDLTKENEKLKKNTPFHVILFGEEKKF